jgi:hypothetical protein
MRHHTPSGSLLPQRRSRVHAAQASNGARVPPEEPFRTIMEPFRIHSVEPVRLPTRAERSARSATGSASRCSSTHAGSRRTPGSSRRAKKATRMSRSPTSSVRWRAWPTA